MKKGFLTKVISGLLIAAQIGVMPVQAYTVEKNMLTDENGYLVKYTDALDFNSKGIFSAFEFNIGCDEDIFSARKGLTSEDMLNIILCNAPSYFLERGYRYRVNKYENDVYGVVVFESYAGNKIPEVSEKLGSILLMMYITGCMTIFLIRLHLLQVLMMFFVKVNLQMLKYL